jgi:hypothetical protein
MGKIIMWVDQKSRKDSNGKQWNFRVWYGLPSGQSKRVFFWDESKEDCGVVFCAAWTHFSRLKQLIEKLVADPSLREKHRKELRFPLERHYSEYGAFPEEN